MGCCIALLPAAGVMNGGGGADPPCGGGGPPLFCCIAARNRSSGKVGWLTKGMSHGAERTPPVAVNNPEGNDRITGFGDPVLCGPKCGPKK